MSIFCFQKLTETSASFKLNLQASKHPRVWRHIHVFLRTDWRAACKHTRWSIQQLVWAAGQICEELQECERRSGSQRIRSAFIAASSLKHRQQNPSGYVLCHGLLKTLQHLQMLHQSLSAGLNRNSTSCSQCVSSDLLPASWFSCC